MFKNKEGEFQIKHIILLIMIIFIMAAGTSYLLLQFYITESGAEEEKEQAGPFHSLGDFVVNLQASSRQFLRVKIVVEAENNQVITELEDKTPQTEDKINTILRGMNLKDIEEPGIPSLKKELKNKLNQILSSGEITSIWFTEILVQ